MELSFEDQLMDLDWFALDESGAIGHFTTAGIWPMPRSVAASKEDLERVQDFFWQKPPFTRVSVEAKVFSYADVNPADETAREWFVHDFVQMAARGLYSYNCFLKEQPPAAYYRVAVPNEPLRVDSLPLEIRDILRRTIMPGVSFARDELIGSASLGT